MLEKGLVQIYTGDGKGKTTAAFGQALRAIGHGNKVLVIQFLKPAELDIGERFALKISGLRIRIETPDAPWDISKSFEDKKQVERMKKEIKSILQRVKETAQKRFYDVIILDEIIYCASKGLAEIEDIKQIIEKRDALVEIILTGRGAPDELIELADYVTEMKNIKHPFEKQIKARKGIEY